MNRDQFNRTEMFNTVSAYMNHNQTLWSATKAVVDTLAEVDASIGVIEGKASKQQAPITGAADQKAQVRLSCEEKILELSDQLSALAEVKGDANLAAHTDWSLSSLDKLTDDELEETGKSIAALATADLAVLADYGVTPADVTTLTGLTTQFHGVKTGPRTAIAGRAGETNTLPDIISNTTSLLRNRLDKLMTKFKKTSPEFYAGYQSARVIVDRGGSGGGATPAPAPVPAPAK